MKNLLAVVAAATILSGCNFDVAPELYVSDLKDVASGKELSLLTPTTLVIEIPSCDKYDEYAERLSGVAMGMLPEFRLKGCEDGGFSDLLRAEAQIPIVADPKVWSQTGSMFGLLVEGQDGKIVVTMLVDQNKQGVLSDRLDDEFHRTLDLSKSTIKVVLNNDLRAPQAYVVKGVFVDGLPIAEPERFELERRRTAEIVLSNVSASRLARHGAVNALILQPPPLESVVVPGLEPPPAPANPLPPAAVVASAPPPVSAPPAPPTRQETATARAAREAGVPEAYYVRLRDQVSTMAARGYPVRSLERGEEGTVVLLIRVHEDGSVIDITIVEDRTDASPRLRRAAQRVVLRASPFDPLPDGAGVKSILLPVVYRIT